MNPAPGRREANIDQSGNTVLSKVANDLPDFVQDHFSETFDADQKDLDLPVFDLVSLQPSCSKQLNRDIRASSFESPKAVSSIHQSFLECDNDLDSDNSGVNSEARNCGYTVQTLPDFLSDGALSGSKHSSAVLSTSLEGTETAHNYRDKELHTVSTFNCSSLKIYSNHFIWLVLDYPR